MNKSQNELQSKAEGEAYWKACEEIAFELLKLLPENKNQIAVIKKRISRKYSLPSLPSDPDISVSLNRLLSDSSDSVSDVLKIKKLLKIKPVRTISGVAVVAVMTSPAPCPHGKCLPCPGGAPVSPQSYTGREPAAMRGMQHNYDPFRQVTARLRELSEIGHDVEKVEIIVMGGTFPARDKEYKDSFILGIYNALNSFDRRKSITQTLEAAKKRNEKARARCIGMTFETRPDHSGIDEIREMLYYGGTKVELGVQNVDDEILEGIKRGHGVEEVKRATRMLKDSAFKVGYHIMPGLPGSNFEKDLEMFRKIFEMDDYKPDYLKIYPTLVVEGTELYELYRKGDYMPYSTDEVAELIAKAKRRFPKWVRVQRIQRDIPVKYAIGLDKGNLRQIVHEKMKEYGWKCRCIRCREAGHVMRKSGLSPERILKESEIMIESYKASGGVEYFISFENAEHDILSGFIKLRFGNPLFSEISNSALVRELHVYGTALPVGKRDESAVQHKGIGEKLLSVAEEIAKEKYDRIAVISGVGVRDYYRKHGYRKRGNYMVKRL
jgi:elongator complex protein 3